MATLSLTREVIRVTTKSAIALTLLVCVACAGEAPPAPHQEAGGEPAETRTAAAAMESAAAATIAASRATIAAAEAAATVVVAQETIAAAEATAAAPTHSPPTATPVPSFTRLPDGTAAAATAEPEGAAQPECDARIAFVRKPGQLWTMKADGSDKKLVIGSGVDVWHPAWFPDGNRLVFTTHQETYFVNSDGQGLTKLPYNYEYPVISPDGQRLAGKFSQMKPSEHGGQAFVTDDLVVRDLDGKGVTNLTRCSEGEHCIITNPSWSPDGLWIAAGMRRASMPGYELWLFRSDGAERRKILSLAGMMMPSWSPDGRRIAFLTREPVQNGAASLWILDADGSGLRQLPMEGLALLDSPPNWSPDGKAIAFVAGLGALKNFSVYTIGVGGGEAVALGDGFDPAWQPCPSTETR
jgi:Tol biopolymer transport system component